MTHSPPLSLAARNLVGVVERRRVQAEFDFALADGVVVLRPTVRVALWGARGRARKTAFCDEVLAIHRDLLAFAEHILPPPRSDVLVDVFAPEPALFERVAGRDEVRLWVRGFADDRSALSEWAHALWMKLRGCAAKVEPSTWPRAGGWR